MDLNSVGKNINNAKLFVKLKTFQTHRRTEEMRKNLARLCKIFKIKVSRMDIQEPQQYSLLATTDLSFIIN